MSVSLYFYLDDPQSSSTNYGKDPNSNLNVFVPASSFIKKVVLANNVANPLVGTATIAVKLEGASDYLIPVADGMTATSLNTRGQKSVPGIGKYEITSDSNVVIEVSANITGRIYGRVDYEAF